MDTSGQSRHAVPLSSPRQPKIGICLLAVAVLYIAYDLATRRWHPVSEDQGTLDVQSPIPLVIALVGFMIGLALMRVREVFVDRERGVFSEGWRFLGWKRQRVWHLDPAACVELWEQVYSVGRRQEEMYRVDYVDAHVTVRLLDCGSYKVSRDRAERLAEAMGCNLHDRVKRVVVRAPAEPTPSGAARVRKG